MSTGAIIGIVIAVIIVILILSFVGIYNGFVKLKNRVEEAFATMDVYMKKRFDLIPNLVETVKGYAAHEKETLLSVTQARTAVMQSSTTEERLKNENVLSGALKNAAASGIITYDPSEEKERNLWTLRTVTPPFLRQTGKRRS